MKRSPFPGTTLFVLLALSCAACTPEDAAPWGKAILAFMILLLVAGPILFLIAWRRRVRSDRDSGSAR